MNEKIEERVNDYIHSYGYEFVITVKEMFAVIDGAIAASIITLIIFAKVGMRIRFDFNMEKYAIVEFEHETGHRVLFINPRGKLHLMIYCLVLALFWRCFNTPAIEDKGDLIYKAKRVTWTLFIIFFILWAIAMIISSSIIVKVDGYYDVKWFYDGLFEDK